MKKIIITLLLICLLNGCAFYRHDVDTAYNPLTKQNEVVRDSKTYWSFLKNITLGMDGLTLNSEVGNAEIKTPIDGVPIGVSIGDNK